MPRGAALEGRRLSWHPDVPEPAYDGRNLPRMPSCCRAPPDPKEGPMITVPETHLRHQQLIVTLYGLYGRQVGGAFPVSVLISMLGDLGHDAPGVRSSVSRLKAKGVLNS